MIAAQTCWDGADYITRVFSFLPRQGRAAGDSPSAAFFNTPGTPCLTDNTAWLTPILPLELTLCRGWAEIQENRSTPVQHLRASIAAIS